MTGVNGEKRGGHIRIVQNGDGECLGQVSSLGWLEDLEGDEPDGRVEARSGWALNVMC